MDGVGIAAVIGALVPLLGLIGAGIAWVVKMILDAYKQQVIATEKAKDGEISALGQRIERHMEDISFLRRTVDNQADTIASHEETIGHLQSGESA